MVQKGSNWVNHINVDHFKDFNRKIFNSNLESKCDQTIWLFESKSTFFKFQN